MDQWSEKRGVGGVRRGRGEGGQWSEKGGWEEGEGGRVVDKGGESKWSAK